MDENKASDSGLPAMAEDKPVTVKPKRINYGGIIEGLVRDSISALMLGDSEDESSKKFAKMLTEESDALRNELAGSNPSAIEKLLAERIATCAAIASMFDYQHVWALRKNKASSAEFWSKEAERANNRVLKGVAILAQVRKVQGPMVQVNIGEKQVNVAGPVSVSNS